MDRLDEASYLGGAALFNPRSWPEARVERPSALAVDMVTSRSLRDLGAWADLCARALEPNVFLEPAFALALFQRVDPKRRPDILMVWETNDDAASGRLVGLMPVKVSRSGIGRGAQAFHDKQIALGMPLLDVDRAEDAFVAMLAWLQGHEHRPATLMFTKIPLHQPFHTLVEHVCGSQSLPVKRLEENSRAILQAPVSEQHAVVCSASAKWRKEWRRQSRRLSEVGQQTTHSATTPLEVTRAVERFLALEHSGWKGLKGSSFLADPRRAAFLRHMTRVMALEGKCRVDSLEIDNVPVAMGIILTARGRAHFWKTAYDERFAAYSPGVQFANKLTHIQLADRSVATTDSCAQPDHPMIDRIWPSRMPIADLMIGITPNLARFERAWCFETCYRSARAAAKSLVSGHWPIKHR